MSKMALINLHFIFIILHLTGKSLYSESIPNWPWKNPTQ